MATWRANSPWARDGVDANWTILRHGGLLPSVGIVDIVVAMDVDCARKKRLRQWYRKINHVCASLSIESHTTHRSLHHRLSNIHTRCHLYPQPLSQHTQIRLQLLLIIRTHQRILSHSTPHPYRPWKVHLPQNFSLLTTQQAAA